MRRLACLLLITTALAAGAEDKVYRYVGPDGAIHYTDKPPTKDAKPVQLPQLQTFQSSRGTSSAPAVTTTPQRPAAPQFSLSIDSPTPEQTFRDVGAQITVTVSILPGLVTGYGLIYSVDGQPQHEGALGQTSFNVGSLERGSHTLSVSLVNDKGSEVASNSITVHMKPPVVRP